jgi:hypothetical protein
MTLHIKLLTLGFAGLLSASLAAADADEVEVLARGPVHEAYAEPSEREPTATPVIAKAPPKPIEELPPDQKPEGDNVQWIPGYWGWDEDKKDYLWVSGFWRIAPPGRSWMPGSWRQAGDGWQWTGGFWAAAKQDKAAIEYLPQPPAPLDVDGPSTPAPTESHVYIPGCWVWRDRYVWQPGYYYEHNPNWIWTPSCYRWTPSGYVFVNGYWDYPLVSRGVLFAPAYIPPAVYMAPSFVYTPTVIVREQALYGAFFARRGWGGYFFGDYFGPRYVGLGFTAWNGFSGVSLTVGRGFYDPLFSHYSVGFRNDPFWNAGIYNLYGGRYRGTFARPPVNLVQQTTVINNINKTVVKNTTVNNINNVQMLSPLSEASKTANLKLQPVAERDRRSQQEAARNYRDLATRRADLERNIAQGANARPANAARTAQLDVPRANPVTARGSSNELPKQGKDNPAAKMGNPGANPRPTPQGKVDPGSPRPTPAGKADNDNPRPNPKGSGVIVPPAKQPPVNVAPKGDAPRPKELPTPKGVPDPTPAPKGNPGPRPTPKGDVNPAPRPSPKGDVNPAPRPAPKGEVTPAPRPVPAGNPAPRPAPTPAPRPAPGPSPTPPSAPAPRPQTNPPPAPVAPRANPAPSPAPKQAPSSPRPAPKQKRDRKR